MLRIISDYPRQGWKLYTIHSNKIGKMLYAFWEGWKLIRQLKILFFERGIETVD